MPRFNRSQFRTQQRRVRNRDWAGAVSATYGTLAASSKVVVATLTLSNPGIAETILRTVGGISISSDQSAALEVQSGAVGGCIITDRASTVGITAIPDPVTEVADDMWFLFQSFAQRTDLTVGGVNAFWYSFDSKAKRIVEDGFQGAFVLANANATDAIGFAFHVRVLTQVRGT